MKVSASTNPILKIFFDLSSEAKMFQLFPAPDLGWQLLRDWERFIKREFNAQAKLTKGLNSESRFPSNCG